MKKLLTTAAVCGLAVAASPAQAQIDLELGGWFKGYGAYVDQDEAAGSEARNFDMLRSTEVHFGGETTLDNGLTVGFHLETEADGEDGMGVQESYAYFSGGWGRVNFGAEDGAAYLLQVEAPSADSNIDGIRQYIQPVNYDVMTGGTITGDVAIDYAQDVSAYADKLTYLSPVMNGFQAGASYTPDVASNGGYADDLSGVRADDEDAFGSAYEAAARYEGMFNNVGVIAGAGYTHVDREDGAGVGEDDRQAWNAGVDLDIGPFGVGAAYMQDDFGVDGAGTDEEQTMVVGVDYTTGPFKLGASYYNIDNYEGLEDNLDTNRYTGGVVYTYGPGMTFRGSVSHIEHDVVGGDLEATSFLLGTQVSF